MLLDTQTATSVTEVNPLQWHAVGHADTVSGRDAVGQFSGWLTAAAHIPIGKALRAAVDLTLNAIRLLDKAAFDE